MVMKTVGSDSPLSSWLITFFIADAFATGSPPSSASRMDCALSGRSTCTSSEQLRSTTSAMLARASLKRKG